LVVSKAQGQHVNPEVMLPHGVSYVEPAGGTNACNNCRTKRPPNCVGHSKRGVSGFFLALARLLRPVLELDAGQAVIQVEKIV
jgi:hypothetical protein